LIAAVFRFLLNAVTSLATFLIALTLGILAAILYLIPWLLRTASVLGWLIAAFLCITTLRGIYSPFTDAVPMFALEFVVIMLALLWAMVGLREGRQVWGILAAGALTMWGLSSGMTWLSIHWQYAQLFFSVLPPALLAVGMISLSIRTRARRLNIREARQSKPAEASA
jgi:hypothetical protein